VEEPRSTGVITCPEFLISQYKENKGYVDPHTKIEQLERQLKAKTEQYEAMKKDIEARK
jgi:hypothetical protein